MAETTTRYSGPFADIPHCYKKIFLRFARQMITFREITRIHYMLNAHTHAPSYMAAIKWNTCETLNKLTSVSFLQKQWESFYISPYKNKRVETHTYISICLYASANTHIYLLCDRHFSLQILKGFTTISGDFRFRCRLAYLNTYIHMYLRGHIRVFIYVYSYVHANKNYFCWTDFRFRLTWVKCAN